MRHTGLILAVVLGAVGCAQQPVTQAPGLRMHTLECGQFIVHDASPFSDGGEYDGQRVEMTVTCYLIRHAKGDLIWDTGLPDSLAELPQHKRRGPFEMWVPRTLESQLETLGLTVADIDYLAISHSHFDHSGNANLFAHATWLSDPKERAWMFSPEAAEKGADKANFSELKNAKTVDVVGEHDVFGDGSVTLISTPGHTPGHMVLLLRFPNAGPVLLSGDLYHLHESRTHKRVPRFNVDREATLESMEKFEQLARDTGARVIIQHVREDVATLPAFPAYLD